MAYEVHTFVIQSKLKITYAPPQGGKTRRAGAVLPREVRADQIQRGIVYKVTTDTHE